jgi:hypothetical protein
LPSRLPLPVATDPFRGKQVTAQEIYYNPALGNRHGGVVLIGDFLFGDKDQNGNPWCANFLTGQTNAAWKKQSKGSGSMSLTYAEGHLHCRYANGVVALVKATPVAYRETGSFRIPNVKGPPGEGKSFLASAIQGILPRLSDPEKVELTKIYSAYGALERDGVAVTRRPMRSIHSTASKTGTGRRGQQSSQTW